VLLVLQLLILHLQIGFASLAATAAELHDLVVWTSRLVVTCEESAAVICKLDCDASKLNTAGHIFFSGGVAGPKQSSPELLASSINLVGLTGQGTKYSLLELELPSSYMVDGQLDQ